MRNNENPHNIRSSTGPRRVLKIVRLRRSLTPQQQQAKVKGLAAINRVRRGQSKSLSVAAKAEGTTVKAIRKFLPAALVKSRPGQPIRVKAGDPYSARVQILTDAGPITVTARGSRQRDLAGEHRKIYDLVLRNKLPIAALKQFRGKKVGGKELLTNYEELRTQVQAGVLEQLNSLYVSPETSA